MVANLDEYGIVIPAKNEANGLSKLLPELLALLPSMTNSIFVIDDGSNDKTRVICEQAGISHHRHFRSLGNGAAIKTGINMTSKKYILFMDGDGQHTAKEAIRLIHHHAENPVDMLVGARAKSGQSNILRMLANTTYNKFSSFVTSFNIRDLTSGMRIVNVEKFQKIAHILPDGFSYPTTSTIAFLKLGYSIDYLSIKVEKNNGKSHIKPLSDGLKFLLIIIKVISLYSPLRVFLPISTFFMLSGISYAIFTLSLDGRFTNMSVLLFTTGIVTFLMGLISEQITTLIYKN